VIHYLDTSALVKLYVDESRSEEALDLLRQSRTAAVAVRLFASRLAYPETLSAVARRARQGSLSGPEARLISRFVSADFRGNDRPYEILEPTAAVVDEAAELVQRHPLKAFDAVHLAGALLLHQAAGGACILVAADRQLLAAAMAEGIPVLDLR
jgi:predicted nucleic acid-binding protein